MIFLTFATSFRVKYIADISEFPIRLLEAKNGTLEPWVPVNDPTHLQARGRRQRLDRQNA